MSIERIGIEKALPMMLLGAGCVVATAIVFGVLCGQMIRARRRIERLQRENDEKQKKYPSQTMNNTNQSAAIHHLTTTMPIALDSTFKIHPYHPFSMKHIIQL